MFQHYSLNFKFWLNWEKEGEVRQVVGKSSGGCLCCLPAPVTSRWVSLSDSPLLPLYWSWVLCSQTEQVLIKRKDRHRSF